MNNESLTITSRAETAFCGLEDVFITMYCKKDFERILHNMKGASDQTRSSRLLPLLYGMLDACDVEYEYGMDDKYYQELIEKNISSNEYGEKILADRMVLALFDRYNGYSTPSEYMDRILVRLQKEEDKKNWGEASLRLRILKQFVKYGNYLEDAGFVSRPTIEKHAAEKSGKKKKDLTASDVADVISEEVFADFDDPDKANPEYRKPNGKFGLLKLCDDLAYGKFRTQGATKKGLYFLAIVLDMRLAGLPGADEENDIMKNLFRDYYSNNLMRYMTEACKGHLREFETPSGQGINFKNFAEMVYLYYISRNDMNVQEKIAASSKMIDELAQTAKDNRAGGKKAEKEVRRTEFYRMRFMNKDRESSAELFSEDILNLNEEEFRTFMLENYDCDTGTGKTFMSKGVLVESAVGALQIDIDQNTAYAAYTEILDELVNEQKKFDMTLDDCNYGLWFVDVAAYDKEGLESIPDRCPEVDKKKYDEFMEVLKGANLMIGNTVNESTSELDEDQEHAEASKIRIKALSVSKPEEITRTSLMTAYYYYFNITHEYNKQLAFTGYKDVFEEYKRRLDPILEKCGYQEISGKNLFDVVLTFSSYARLIM